MSPVLPHRPHRDVSRVYVGRASWAAVSHPSSVSSLMLPRAGRGHSEQPPAATVKVSPQKAPWEQGPLQEVSARG